MAKFFVGQIVHHKKFDYRGVVFDVDATFQGTDEWQELVARSRPPKHMPWYHVLVDGAEHTTYMAERHLESDERGKRIKHPLGRRVLRRVPGGALPRHIAGSPSEWGSHRTFAHLEDGDAVPQFAGLDSTGQAGSRLASQQNLLFMGPWRVARCGFPHVSADLRLAHRHLPRSRQR